MLISKKTLKLLALATWIIGAVVLFLKGYALFAEANELRTGEALNYLPFPFALVVGGLQARFIFLHTCKKNLARIDSLEKPRLWQFFRMGFFIFLFCMISLGAWLSQAAAGNYGMLVAVSSLDFMLSVSLLGSLVGFKGRMI
jgi:uncharacterized membrane protein YjjP (DUF1212 family)